MLEGTDYDSRADIWSLGCVIFNMHSFDYPFNAGSEERMVQKICNHPHKPIDPRVPQEIRDIYEICMNKNYKTRPKISDLMCLDVI